MTQMEKQRSEKYAENEKEEDTRSNRGVCWETEEGQAVWWSARPAVTQHHKLGNWVPATTLTRLLRFFRLEVNGRVLAWTSFGESWLCGLQMPQERRERERERETR